MILLPILTPALSAQNVSIVRANSIEVGPFVGATYGLDKVRLLAGGNVTYAVTPRILPYVEYSYFRGFVRTEAFDGDLGTDDRVVRDFLFRHVLLPFHIVEGFTG